MFRKKVATRVSIWLLAVAMLVIATGAVSAQEPVVIRWWQAANEAAGPLNAVEAWNAMNPDIQVELVQFDNNTEGNAKLDTALLAGEVDVFLTYRWEILKRRVDAGLVEPLQDYLGDFDVQEEFGVGFTAWDGNLWALPGQGSSHMVLINKSHFDEAGLEVPTDWTWEEYQAIAAQLAQGEGLRRRYASIWANFPYTNSIPFYEDGSTFYYDPEDACVTRFDDPVFVEALTLQRDMEQARTHVAQADISAARLLIQSEFYAENASMMLGGTWLLATVPNTEDFPRDFQVAFAPVPHLSDPLEYRAGVVGDFVAVASTSEHPAEAAQFLEWYATEGFIYMAEYGRFGAWKGLTPEMQSEAYLARFEDPEALLDTESFMNVVFDLSREFSEPTIITAASELSQIYEEHTNRVLLGELTPEEAAAAMKELGDAALQAACNT